MGLSGLDSVLWGASFLGELALAGIFLWRHRLTKFPIFFWWVFFLIIRDAGGVLVYRLASPKTYFWTYWILVVLDSLLQLGVVWEMSASVLRPAGIWVRSARLFFFVAGTLGAALAAALSFAVNPQATSGLFAWSIRLDLFTSLLIAELVVAMSFSAQRLGLQWRSWVIGLGQGLMLWVSVSLFVATAQSYWGWAQSGYYIALDHLRILAFIAALGYWCVVFWRIEPERKPISPEMMKYLYSLHSDLSYDLGRVQSKRK